MESSHDKPSQDPWTGQPKQQKNPKPSSQGLADSFKKQLTQWVEQLRRAQAHRQHPLSPQRKSGRSSSNKRKLISFCVNLCLCWVLWGIYWVNPDEQAIITRFGKYRDTFHAGIHWHVPLVERVTKLSVNKPQRYYQTIETLTAEGMPVSATITVHYRIQDPTRYLFYAANPITYLQQITLASLRKTISQYSLAELLNLTSISESIQQAVMQQLRQTRSHYPMGLAVSSVSLPSIRIPEPIKNVFKVTQQAQQQAEHLQYQAKTQAIKTEREAQTQAKQLYLEAKTWQHRIITHARTETTRLIALLPLYEKAPQLTVQQLHLEMLEASYTQKNARLTPFSLETHTSDQQKNTQPLPSKKSADPATDTPTTARGGYE